MTEQPYHGQPNQPQQQQPPYPYQQPQPYPPQQQWGYQGPPPQQQYGAPQPYPQQQPYPQVPPQQYPGQQYPGQPPYGQQGQPFPGQPFPGQPPQNPNQAQAEAKPKKKRGCWWTFFIVIFSPLIALAFVAYGIYWALCWLLTPVALVLHFVFCGIGLVWYSGVKVMASGRSKYRLFQPLYPKFPPLWTGEYWLRLNRNVRSTAEVLGAIGQLLDG